MSKNALTTFTDQMPAHLVRAMAEGDGNIDARATVPSLTYSGKKWTINLNGDQTLLQKRNEEGDLEPATQTRWIILNYGKRRGRAYYEAAYDPNKPGRPLCWSDDGITPAKALSEPQAKKCADCPLSVKGSKTNDNGTAGYACAEFRMVAVIPANKPDFEPLRLKLAMTSDYDGQSPDLEQRGWFAFSNYVSMLRANGCNATYAMVTKFRFDPNKDWPKVIFSRAENSWLDEETFEQVKEVAHSEKVKDLLNGSWSPEGADGQRVDDAGEAEQPKPAAKPKAEQPKPKSKPKSDEDDELPARGKPFTEDDIELTTTPKAKQADVKAQQQAKKQQALDEDEDVVDENPAPKKPAAATKTNGKAAPKAKPAAEDGEDDPPAKAPPKASKAAPAAPANLSSVLSDWDDD